MLGLFWLCVGRPRSPPISTSLSSRFSPSDSFPLQQRAFNNKGVEVEFDGMWSSSLTASSAKGKPDIETVDTTERLKLVAETLDVSLRGSL